MKERRVGAVASLPLERGRASGWGRSPFLGQEGVGVVVPSKPEAWTSKKKGCCALQTKGLAKLSDGDAKKKPPSTNDWVVMKQILNM